MAIDLTEKAASKVMEIIRDGQSSGSLPGEKMYLRLRVVGGGCSGFQHKLDLDPEVKEKVDEVFHVGARMRRVALQRAVGGMALSLVGMGVAALGYLPPVAGAVFQEVIDVAAVLNALRTALPPRSLTDYQPD